MTNLAKEDQEQRENVAMEDSDTMTVEFLRARLLSERSISKRERQRADDLAKRVAELEEQLKFVSLQRKKAEKATSDVLTILENCGISDVSEGFGSCSDDEAPPHEFQACDGSVTINESSTAARFKRNEVEAYSSSEFESSQSTGRSLSWKSGKNSQYYHEKKKPVDMVRRKAIVASTSSSSRRVGKSCRKVRRRDTRSPEELPTDGLEQVTCGTDVSNCSDSKQYNLRDRIEYGNEKKSTKFLSLNSKTRKDNGHSTHDDMDSALQHQVQLIEQYEAEEKSKREWEDKFKENNVGKLDSCEMGNHSDMTEELYDVKSPELSCGAPALDLNNQETNREPVNAGENPQDKILSGKTAACEKSASEFSFPISEVELKGKHPVASSSSQLVVSSQETSDDLGTVLEALQRAKLSLNQKLSTATLETSKPEIDNRFSVLNASPGIFRLPIDCEYKATGHHIADEQFGYATSTPEIANDRFLSGGYNNSSERSLTSLSRTVSTGIESGVPPQMYLSRPRLEVGSTSTSYGKTNQFDGSSYPFFQNTATRSPLTEGASRSFSNTEIGLPPIIRLPLYDDVVRRNMQM